MHKFLKIFFAVLIIIYAALVAFYGWLNFGSAEKKDVKWGITFGHSRAEELGLDWKETYLALLDDVGVRRIRIPIYWDELQPDLSKQSYNFKPWDWQLDRLEERGGKAILVVGRKLPRWPECRTPDGYRELNTLSRSQKTFQMIRNVVSHYKDNPTVVAWQVENEPYVDFGNCSYYNSNWLEKEVELVKKLDPSRPVILSDEGQGSFWFGVADDADIIGVSIYRFINKEPFGLIKYPFSSVMYERKTSLLHLVYPGKKVIASEFQAEPWPVTGSVEGDYETMDPARFKKHIEFAKNTGFDEVYLWGAEWWYWLKKEGEPEIWEKAKSVFKP